MNKNLVAYFSCSGVTRELAQKISQASGGDLYEIKPAQPYTDADLDWMDKNSRSTVEMQDKSFRPEISGKCENIDDYDTVFLGFPIWWYVAPTIINTFLESYDFSGKTIVPFFTSGGSGAGETDKYLHSSCSNSTQWRPAKRFYASETVEELKSWIESLNL